jgi:nucleoside-diphosphate-sugar epimerase
MRILVTGATGFIGTRVVDRLAGAAAFVRVLVLPTEFASSPTAAALRARDGIEIAVGDLEDGEALVAATAGVDVVHHLGGALPRSGTAGLDVLRVNVGGTDSLLRASVRNGVRRVVLASSAIVYGPPGPETREDAPLRPRGHYAWSKLAAEEIVTSYARRFGIEPVILRPTVTYGTGGHFVERLCVRMLATPPALLAGDQCVQWLHVDDLADAIIAAGGRPAAAGNVFNLAGTEIASLSEVASLARAGAGLATAPPVLAPNRSRRLRFDTAKAREVLGFRPKVPLERGIPELVRTMRPVGVG